MSPRWLLTVWLAALSLASSAAACPFCTALKPTLAQRRESATVVAIGECLEAASKQATFRIHKVLKGSESLRASAGEQVNLSLDTPPKPGSLAILFGEGSTEKLAWSCETANELALSYFVKAPSLRSPAAERMKYFVHYLEHGNALAADDAFNEFGHAPYDAVEQVAEQMDAGLLRRWLADPNVRDERKGFYGLALGLCGRHQDRPQQEAFLRQQIERPADDFRAGFDGILGGYLVLAGEPALKLIEQRYLKDPQARIVDVRHTMTALRFYQEFGREIPTARLAHALEHLLKRPEFAAEAIVDLARWKDWEAVPQVAAVYASDPALAATRRAVVGYLLACPTAAGADALAQLRRKDPQGVAEAEKRLQFGSAVRID